MVRQSKVLLRGEPIFGFFFLQGLLPEACTRIESGTGTGGNPGVGCNGMGCVGEAKEKIFAAARMRKLLESPPKNAMGWEWE